MPKKITEIQKAVENLKEVIFLKINERMTFVVPPAELDQMIAEVINRMKPTEAVLRIVVRKHLLDRFDK